MQDLNDFYYFVKAVEHGGFAPAGRALGIPKSKLSRRIATLEERLGVRLIYRSTRQFNVTEIGQSFLEHCQAMLVEAQVAQEVIQSVKAEPSGTIKLTCPIALLHAHIGQVLADFMTKYPKVTVHLEATNRRVDLLAEGIDVAIRVRPPPLENSELILKVLSDRGQCLLASPSLIDKYGLPVKPSDLTGWPSLGLGEPQQSFMWTLFGPDDAVVALGHQPRYVTTDMIALRNAAIKGVGVVQLPSLMVPEQLENGSLVHLLPDWRPRREIIHLVYPSRRCLLPSVRALIDYLQAYFQSFEED
ncbi:MAG: LysR family transcriptional regulator [Pseudomonadales bacterium]